MISCISKRFSNIYLETSQKKRKKIYRYIFYQQGRGLTRFINRYTYTHLFYNMNLCVLNHSKTKPNYFVGYIFSGLITDVLMNTSCAVVLPRFNLNDNIMDLVYCG